MIKKHLSFLLLFLTSAIAFGQVKVPRRSFPVAELEKAKAMAAERNQPLVFVDT